MEIGVDFLDCFSPPKIINKGTIIKKDGETVPYVIELGLSKSSILKCNEWKDFVTEFIIEYVNKNPDDKDYKKTLQKYIMLEDYRWNWSKKALFYNASEYNWFFLKTTDGITKHLFNFSPQKICNPEY